MSRSRRSLTFMAVAMVMVALVATACTRKSTPSSPKAASPAASPSSAASPAAEALGTAESVTGRAACQAYIESHSEFPDFNQLPEASSLGSPDAQGIILAVARPWADATRTIGTCTAENGALKGGDTAVAQYSAGLSLALASSMGYAPPDGDPRIAAEIDIAMNALLDSYPDSCWAQLADGWQQEQKIDSDIGQSCAQSG